MTQDPEQFLPDPPEGLRALRRQHMGVLGVPLVLVAAILLGLLAQSEVDRLATPVERWAKTALAASAAIFALGPAWLFARFSAREARKIYRRGQTSALGWEGWAETGEVPELLLPASQREVHVGRRSTLLAVTDQRVVFLVTKGTSAWEAQTVCARPDVQEVVIEPKTKGGAVRDFYRLLAGTRYQLTVVHAGSRSTWEIEALFPPEQVAAWFAARGFRLSGDVPSGPLGEAPRSPS